MPVEHALQAQASADQQADAGPDGPSHQPHHVHAEQFAAAVTDFVPRNLSCGPERLEPQPAGMRPLLGVGPALDHADVGHEPHLGPFRRPASGLDQAVGTSSRTYGIGSLGRAQHQQFIVQTQDDSRVQVAAASAYGDGPHLEQLGGCPLDHRVAGVPAPGGQVGSLRLGREARPESATSAPTVRRRCGSTGRPDRRRRRPAGTASRSDRPIPCSAVRRRPFRRFGRTSRPEPQSWPPTAGTRSRSATGAYRSGSALAAVKPRSAETAASTRGSIWPRSARTKTWPGRRRRPAAVRPADCAARPTPSSARPHHRIRSTAA